LDFGDVLLEPENYQNMLELDWKNGVCEK